MAVIDIEYGKEILASSETKSENSQDMEMVLQNSSLGHEYVLMEFNETSCPWEQAELSHRLEEYKHAYFTARDFLLKNHPDRLEALEAEIFDQKVRAFKAYHA